MHVLNNTANQSIPSEDHVLNVSSGVIDTAGLNGSSILRSVPIRKELKLHCNNSLDPGLPEGHTCDNFAFPPPPSDRKRIGPRRKSSSHLCL